MDIFGKMVNTQSIMFIYMVCGIILSKTGVISKTSRGSFVKLLTNLVMPAMIIDSFNKPLDLEELKRAALIMIISACVCLLTYGISKLIWRKMPQERVGTLTLGTMFSNAGNAGTPVVAMVFGEAGVLYAAFFMIPVRILLWTMGISMYTKGKGREKVSKVLLNPCVLAVVFGTILNVCPFVLPGIAGSAIAGIGGMTGPLAMMIIGASLAEQKPRELLDRDVLILSGVRLFAVPLVTLALLRLLGVDAETLRIVVILLAMPVAYTTAILAERYNANYHFAGKCVCLSTVLSLVTVPLICMLL